MIVGLLSRSRTFVKQLPPVRAWRAHEREYQFAHGKRRLFRGVYGSFEEAASAAPRVIKADSKAFEVNRISRIGYRRVTGWDYPVIFWLGRILTAGSSVLDFGGSVGISYYSFSKHLSFPTGLTWKVCDTPEVVESGRAIAEEEGAANLTFTSEFHDGSGSDILIAAGMLHYVDEPLAALVSRLPEKPKHILVNKTPLQSGSPFVTLCNYAGHSFIPYHIFNRDAFVESICRLGYELVDEWENPGLTCEIISHPERSLDVYSGLYFRQA